MLRELSFPPFSPQPNAGHGLGAARGGCEGTGLQGNKEGTVTFWLSLIFPLFLSSQTEYDELPYSVFRLHKLATEMKTRNGVTKMTRFNATLLN